MNTVLETLKQQLTELDARIATDTVERDRVAAAIAALEGNAPVKGKIFHPRPGTTVPAVLADVVLAFDRGVAFDKESLIAKTQELKPNDTGRVKAGIHGAILSLCKKGIIRRCPGGFCRT